MQYRPSTVILRRYCAGVSAGWAPKFPTGNRLFCLIYIYMKNSISIVKFSDRNSVRVRNLYPSSSEPIRKTFWISFDVNAWKWIWLNPKICNPHQSESESGSDVRSIQAGSRFSPLLFAIMLQSFVGRVGYKRTFGQVRIIGSSDTGGVG